MLQERNLSPFIFIPGEEDGPVPVRLEALWAASSSSIYYGRTVVGERSVSPGLSPGRRLWTFPLDRFAPPREPMETVQTETPIDPPPSAEDGTRNQPMLSLSMGLARLAPCGIAWRWRHHPALGLSVSASAAHSHLPPVRCVVRARLVVVGW